MDALLRELVEQSNDGMAAVSGDCVVFINTRLGSLLGRGPEEIAFGGWLSWFAPEDRARVEAGHGRRMLGEGLCERYEAALLHSSGRRAPVEATFRPWDESGARATLLTVRDLSLHKQELAARLDTEARIRALLEHAALGIAITDHTGRHLMANPALLAMLGLSLEEFLALRAEEFTHPEDRKPDLTLWHELERGERDSYQRDTRFVRKSGEVVHVRLTVSFARGADGRPTAILTFAEDVTERKREEEARERLVAELQQALQEVKTLSGLLPICSYCKQIRDDEGYWHSVEAYVSAHSEAEFSHGICPSCLAKARERLLG